MSTIKADGTTIINSVNLDNSVLEKTTYFDVFNEIKELNNYLEASDILKNAPLEQSTKEQKFNKFQFLATINSFVANNKLHDSLIHSNERSTKEIYQNHVDSLISNKPIPHISVIDEIIHLSKNEKVLMLNENHWYPKHRLLASQLLLGLKQNGFQYLAIEAIDSKKDSILNIRKFPSKNTGYYTREPFFAHFTRKAIDLGFTIIQYDDLESKNRELAQAENLKTILDNDANAKIFVYAGLDHILECSDSKKRMAEYLKEISGINPLTINQSKIVANTTNNLELFSSDSFKGISQLNSSVDYFLVNNLKPNLRDIYQNLEFKTFTIKLKRTKNDNNKNVLITIYNKTEYDLLHFNAIPIHNYISELNQEINIALPEGNYYVNIFTNDNVKLFSDYISIR